MYFAHHNNSNNTPRDVAKMLFCWLCDLWNDSHGAVVTIYEFGVDYKCTDLTHTILTTQTDLIHCTCSRSSLSISTKQDDIQIYYTYNIFCFCGGCKCSSFLPRWILATYIVLFYVLMVNKRLRWYCAWAVIHVCNDLRQVCLLQ